VATIQSKCVLYASMKKPRRKAGAVNMLIYAVGPDGRKLVGRSERPLFAGDRQAAHTFAKRRAAEFEAVDYHVDKPDPFFSGHDVVKRELHLFIIKPAMPA
jgi:hypothetical protein